ncbi:hypothetical protein BM1_05758 [Bipolaris maydis]|nr:hypothetical protein BM1_05758 [Bipolaris maydis]
MHRPLLSKHPLKKAATPLTSTLVQNAAASRGEVEFVIEPRKAKVVSYNPLLTASPFLDPAVERKRNMVHRGAGAK